MRVEVAPIVRDRKHTNLNGPWELVSSWESMDWALRPKVALEVGDDASLESVLSTAAQELGFSPSEDRLQMSLFSLIEGSVLLDDNGAPKEATTFVDSNGAARWNLYPAETTIQDVIEAVEAHSAHGDPKRLYLPLDWPLGKGGNGWGVWLQLAVFASFTFNVLDIAFRAGEITLEAKAALQHLSKILARRRVSWDQSGGHLDDFEALLMFPRRTGEAARLLNISEDEVPLLLRFLGFKRDEYGFWRPAQANSEDEVDELLQSFRKIHAGLLPPKNASRLLRDTLGQPRGRRLAYVESRLDQLAFNYHSMREDFHVAFDDSDLNRLVVWDANSDEPCRLGTILDEGTGDHYSVQMPSGESAQADGAELHFSSIEEAGRHLYDRRIRRGT